MEAVLLETFRYSAIIPLIPRANSMDTTVNGCFVPKVGNLREKGELVAFDQRVRRHDTMQDFLLIVQEI